MKPKLNNKKANNKLKVEHKRYHAMLTFNFSYISLERCFNYNHCNKNHKSSFFDAIMRLSSESKTLVLSLPKETGLENMSEDDVHFKENRHFSESGRDRECEDGYWVFRFGGRKHRCIGKICDNVFYVLCIDTDLKSYDHGS